MRTARRAYDLARSPNGEQPQLLPIPPDVEATTMQQKEKPTATVGRAEITLAMFLLSSTPETPIEITIEGDSLRTLAEREAVKALDEAWDSVGRLFAHRATEN